jgi:hypothetical protein
MLVAVVLIQCEDVKENEHDGHHHNRFADELGLGVKLIEQLAVGPDSSSHAPCMQSLQLRR